MRKQLAFISFFLVVAMVLIADPKSAATSAFDSYCSSLESRLARQHLSPNSFLATVAYGKHGDPIIERLAPPDAAGALIHHWRGSVFIEGANISDFERLLRDFNSYPKQFSPQVLKATVLAQEGNHVEATIRVRQKHGLTVVLDSTYDITFGNLDPRHGYSNSRSIKIDEIGAPGTKAERKLTAEEEHGYLWKLNTYWSYEEQGGGLYIQIESLSLTRGIPRGLGWALSPYVESIPRESLEFTLRSVMKALSKA